MTQDFSKTWEELNEEVKATWEASCKKKAIKSWKAYCKRFGYVFNADVVTWDAKNEWDAKHEKARWAAYVENNLTPEQKELLAARNEEKRLKAELKAARSELAAILN